MNEQHDYEMDIAAGRLLRLPCIIGDTITYSKNGLPKSGEVSDIFWRGDRFTYGTQFHIYVAGDTIFERDIIKVN